MTDMNYQTDLSAKLHQAVYGSNFEKPESVSKPQQESSWVSLKILLVDDDPMHLRLIGRNLQILGHTVEAVLSGEEALALLEAGGEPDVVLFDMNLPGKVGARFLPRIRALRPSLSVLIATTRVDPVVTNLVKAHPPAAMIGRPFDKGDLQRILESLSAAG